MKYRMAIALALAPGWAAAQNKTWTTSSDFNTGTLTQVADAPLADQVQLGPTPVTKTSVVWSTNYYPSWVVKLDTNTGKQLGRYDSALVTINGQPTGARSPREYCNWSNQGNCPGRVAVDNNGDVWIINRAFGNQGTLSKFSGSLSHCVDRNHNGVIDTSNDANGDGVIDPNDAKEFFGQADECILTTIPIGPSNVWPRGVAVDRNGKIWASTFIDGKVYRINPAEPVAVEAAVTVGGNPYSLATGGDSLFISNAGGGGTKRVNINTLQVDSAPCGTTYGVVGDPGGTVAWLGSTSNSPGILKADFGNGSCTNYPMPNWVYCVTLDLAGNVWGGVYPSNSVVKMSPAGVILGNYAVGGSSVHGMSVDFNGNVWSVNDSNATLTRIHPDGSNASTFSIGGPTNDSYTPYIYSDFTGVQVNRQAPYMKFGNWSGVFDGGVNQIPWSKVTYNVEQQGAVPNGTTLKVYVRAADDLNTLPTVGYSPVTNGAALNGAILGRYVQVETDLTGPGFATSVLSDVSVFGACSQRGDGCCLSINDCDDGNLCTTDACPAPGAACIHSKVNGCCNANNDCASGNACSIDTCSGPGGTCTHVAKQNCCNVNNDCGDGNLCTQDICSGAGGTCMNPPINGCCNANQDCASGDVCSIDLCSGPGGTCTHFAKANCCKVAGDCDDMNACHTFACSGPGGTCQYTPIAGCCNVNGDCDDGNACTADTCSGAGGTCTHSAIQGCCNVSGDCNDQNACTTDTCSGAGGSCTNAPIANCCNVDGDCDSHDVCVVDACKGAPGGTCQHTAKGQGCCTMDTDCDDMNACTADTCQAGAMCKHDPIPGCCNTNLDCGGGYCINHVCGTSMLGGDGGQVVMATGGCGCEVGARPSRGSGWLVLMGIFVILSSGISRRAARRG